jgi:flagellar biosynthesis chaperone FliJ
MKIATNKIEEVLLSQELKNLTKELEAVGTTLQNIFSKYGTIEGAHKEELETYLCKHVLSAYNAYFAGYATRLQQNLNPIHIPDCLKEVILQWVVKEFFEKLEATKDTLDELKWAMDEIER